MFKANERKPFVANSGVLQVEPTSLQYPHRLNFYDKPPLYDVTLEEFETCAINRLRVLAEIESSAVRNRSWDETKIVTLAQCKKYLPLSATSARSVDRDIERRHDHLGHFVLRLAFCRSEELRRRFIKAETTLFRVRYDSDDTLEKEAFLGSRDFDWIPVDEAERSTYESQLLSLFSGGKEVERRLAFKQEKYYKVKWTRVPDLVEKRKVFLKGGWAYIPGREQSSFIFQEFESRLEKALELTAKSLPRLDEDSRLIPILTNLSQGFLAGVPAAWSGASTEGNGDGIKAEMVDELARQHFPMCMRTLHDNLRKDKLLKHFGRLQYGLFLKVLGLSIEEALTFWRKSFSNITDDEFNKKYKYNVRHSFGLEGRRANYPAKSCQQILMPDNKDINGCPCPYRHYSPENLQTALLSAYSSRGLTTADLPEVMNNVKAGHFHVACTRVFEVTHSSYGVKKGEGVGGGESVTHPNQYAAKSIELEKTKLAGDGASSMVLD